MMKAFRCAKADMEQWSDLGAEKLWWFLSQIKEGTSHADLRHNMKYSVGYESQGRNLSELCCLAPRPKVWAILLFLNLYFLYTK